MICNVGIKKCVQLYTKTPKEINDVRTLLLFNRLPKDICVLSSCSVVGFKSQLDSYLRNIVDLPC